MKTQSPESNLSASLNGKATVKATLAPFEAKLDTTISDSEIILHTSDNHPLAIQRADVRLVQIEQITRAVLADGSEIFMRETPDEIAAMFQAG